MPLWNKNLQILKVWLPSETSFVRLYGKSRKRYLGDQPKFCVPLTTRLRHFKNVDCTLRQTSIDYETSVHSFFYTFNFHLDVTFSQQLKCVWNPQTNPYFKDVNLNITPCTYGIGRDRSYTSTITVFRCYWVLLDEIPTLIWNFYRAHKFVARWVRRSCVYSYLWPFRFVAVSVCDRFGLWPFRFVAVSVCGRSVVAVPVCGRFGVWPFWFVAASFVAVSVCGRSGLRPFRFVAFRFVAVSLCGRFGFCRFGLWPLWPDTT